MKVTYDRVSSDIFLKIDTDKKYKDDYKNHMVNENSISGIIPYYVNETKIGSSYCYNVSGMISMKNKFLDRCIKKEDMETFIRALFDTVNDVKKYMLNADELLLYPELIFWDKDKWKFCYFPFKSKGFETGFERIKEFFVRRINNEDMEGIVFFHKIHKTSLIKPFTIENLINNMQDQSVFKAKESDSESKNIYSIEDRNIKMVCENPDEKSILGHYKKNRKNKEIKKMWGNW